MGLAGCTTNCIYIGGEIHMVFKTHGLMFVSVVTFCYVCMLLLFYLRLECLLYNVGQMIVSKMQ